MMMVMDCVITQASKANRQFRTFAAAAEGIEQLLAKVTVPTMLPRLAGFGGYKLCHGLMSGNRPPNTHSATQQYGDL